MNFKGSHPAGALDGLSGKGGNLVGFCSATASLHHMCHSTPSTRKPRQLCFHLRPSVKHQLPRRRRTIREERNKEGEEFEEST